MSTYIAKRLIQLVVVLVIVSAGVFMAMRLLPGDPIRMYLTSTQMGQVSEQQVAALRHEKGLDRPLVVQYVSWVGGVLKGDLGDSILYGTPVSDQILHRIPITLYIGLLGFVIGTAIGIAIGIVCAVRRGGWLDNVLTTLANIGVTIPIFWLGVMLIYFFSIYLGWLPVGGFTSPFVDLGTSLKQVIMPVFCIAVFPLAATARQTRSSMLEVMRQDYIRTAWSTGLKERAVIVRHALKNGLIPILTLSGANLGLVIGGDVLVESVFNIPGLGRLIVTSVLNQDFPYVQAVVLIVATFILVINLLTDLTYGWLDPRIRYS
jgi:peptide/nickel transport system permease protein